MVCYHPLTAYRSRAGRNGNGKWPIVFNPNEGYIDMPVSVPCGQCIGCRLERSRQWAIRCVHEASLYSRNCFITLTFDDDHLDLNRSLVKEDFVKFMKRLRKKYGEGIRFFHCGEYGSLNGRPHHHACIFNFDFPDKTLWRCVNGVRLYRSASLESLWPFGFCTVGSVSFDSAAYVARYILKKVTGPYAESYYEARLPEYVTMSRRPGIGRDWFLKFKNDVYPNDSIILKNIKCRPPKYYDSIYDLLDPDSFAIIKRRRKLKAIELASDNDCERLAVKEQVKMLSISKLVRPIE